VHLNLTELVRIWYRRGDGHQSSRIDATPVARPRLLRLRHLSSLSTDSRVKPGIAGATPFVSHQHRFIKPE
jgi:hypothetical protein